MEPERLSMMLSSPSSEPWITRETESNIGLRCEAPARDRQNEWMTKRERMEKEWRKKEEKQFVHVYSSADSHKKDSNYCKYKLIIQFIQNIGIRCITVLECALHMTATRGQWSSTEIRAVMSNLHWHWHTSEEGWGNNVIVNLKNGWYAGNSQSAFKKRKRL